MSTLSKTPLLALIRAELKKAGNPAKASQMQAYMKSEMPFHGVQMASSRAISKMAFADLDLADSRRWRRLVLELWRGARYREERYAAINLALDRRARAHQDLDAVPMYEEMIVTGAWWDYVDTIAAHGVGAVLRSHPREMKALMRRWSKDKNLWKRRTSILCQLAFKGETDLELLYDCIEPSIGAPEFFLRKGIGWALRQYAWVDPKEVRRYVRANEERLSPLSKREALKNI